jgi:formylmethanofuran dehydrogenase subunit E
MDVNERKEMFSTAFINGRKPVCGVEFSGMKEDGGWSEVIITYWDRTTETVSIEEYRTNPARIYDYDKVIDLWLAHKAETKKEEYERVDCESCGEHFLTPTNRDYPNHCPFCLSVLTTA